jgi:hypothetical protein
MIGVLMDHLLGRINAFVTMALPDVHEQLKSRVRSAGRQSLYPIKALKLRILVDRAAELFGEVFQLGADLV